MSGNELAISVPVAKIIRAVEPSGHPVTIKAEHVQPIDNNSSGNHTCFIGYPVSDLRNNGPELANRPPLPMPEVSIRRPPTYESPNTNLELNQNEPQSCILFDVNCQTFRDELIRPNIDINDSECMPLFATIATVAASVITLHTGVTTYTGVLFGCGGCAYAGSFSNNCSTTTNENEQSSDKSRELAQKVKSCLVIPVLLKIASDGIQSGCRESYECFYHCCILSCL